MILFTAVFCALLIISEVPSWLPDATRFVKISCEVLIFLLYETATCVSMITFFTWSFQELSETRTSNDSEATGQSSPQKTLVRIALVLWFLYVFILGPVVNVLNHLLLICHSVRKASVNALFRFRQDKNIHLSIELYFQTEKSLTKHTVMVKALYGIIGSILMYGLLLLMISLKIWSNETEKNTMMAAISVAQMYILAFSKFCVFQYFLLLVALQMN